MRLVAEWQRLRRRGVLGDILGHFELRFWLLSARESGKK
jgi:hypothetical protein